MVCVRRVLTHNNVLFETASQASAFSNWGIQSCSVRFAPEQGWGLESWSPNTIKPQTTPIFPLNIRQTEYSQLQGQVPRWQPQACQIHKTFPPSSYEPNNESLGSHSAVPAQLQMCLCLPVKACTAGIELLRFHKLSWLSWHLEITCDTWAGTNFPLGWFVLVINGKGTSLEHLQVLWNTTPKMWKNPKCCNLQQLE